MRYYPARNHSNRKTEAQSFIIFIVAYTKCVATLQQDRIYLFRVRTHWTDQICLAFPKFVHAKFNFFQAWAHWENRKIFVNHKCQSQGNEHYRYTWTRLTLVVCIRMRILSVCKEIEHYLALEMQLEGKLGNRNSCLLDLSKDRHAA